MLVSSIVPLFVNPCATVSVAKPVLPSPCSRISPDALAVSAPFTFTVPFATSVPLLISAAVELTVVYRSVSVPEFVTTPDPVTVELSAAKTSPGATVMRPVTVSVLLLRDRVWVPVPPPTPR